jgi:glycosyltransferase involved in cell wall biosynthesis
MKIVQVQTQAEAAGAQRISDIVGAGLRGKGHSVRTVFMYRKTDAYDADPHADFILKERPHGVFDQLKACIGLVAYVRRERPDAVISYQHYGNIFGTIAALLSGTRRRIVNQSGAPGRRGGMLVAAWIDHAMGALGLYQFSVVNSQWTADQFAARVPAYLRRMKRIDHGVVASAAPMDRAAARVAFGLPVDGPIVASSGRLTRDKNQVALIEAIAAVPGVHLAIAGAGPDRDGLKQLAEARGVDRRVHFVGEVPPHRIFDFLAAGDLYAFASRNETFGLAAVEAAVAGLPVVANDLPVLREVLTARHGAAAVFADAEDTNAFAAAIRRVLEDAALRSELSAAGRSLAERYSTQTMCRRYEELLVDIETLATREGGVALP